MKSPYCIAPSILAADFSCLGEEVRAVIDAGADWIHFDVMDNHYVPNLTFGPMVCEALKSHITVPLDVHLMVEPVDKMIKAFAKAGANIITFHPESSKHVDRSLSLIHDEGCQAGLVLNPATSPRILEYVLDKIDVVLVMSVNPGFGGQKFIPSTFEKIGAIRQLLNSYQKREGRSIRLAVDGGVNVENISVIADAGADTFISGSAIFGHDDYRQPIKAMREALERVD